MENVSNSPKESSVATKLTSKFLAAVFGYMFIGLLITAVVSLGFSYFVAARYSENGLLNVTGQYIVTIGGAVAIILSYVITFVNNIYSMKTGKAPWVGFLLYAVCMGVCFSLVLLSGVDFGTIGEALGLTALSFGVVFLIGYFAKTDLSPLLLVALALLICIVFASAFWFVFYLINPAAFSWFNVGISVAIIIFCLLIVGFEANRMGKIVERGQGNNNLALYCAFSLYTDFIALFIRILALVSSSKKRN